MNRAIPSELLQKTGVIPSILIHKPPLEGLYKNIDTAEPENAEYQQFEEIIVFGLTKCQVELFIIVLLYIKKNV